MKRAIDVHNHLYPVEWIDYLEKRTESPRMERQPTRMAFFSHNVYCASVVHAGHYDVKLRIGDMDKCGIDTQIISLTLPSIDSLPVDEGVRWARKINDYFAEVCQKHPGRFYAFATLPFQDVDEAVKELDRCYRQLGVKGIAMFSNVNFEPISSERFMPVYKKAEEYGLPIFIHPGVPFTSAIMSKHKLPDPLYGFTFDTTMAVISLIWRGIFEQFPKLNVIHAHLGGIVPYLVQRMEDCWPAHQKVLGLHLSKAPSEYYKKHVYPDSMSAYPPAMRCCLDFVGPGHICLGTDYPHRIGNWEDAIRLIENLGLSGQETDDILSGNATRLFRL